MMRRNPVKLRLLRAGFLLFLLGGIGLFCIKKGWGLPCPFFWMTGFRCPACGTTRAIGALLTGDFSKALSYNLAFPALPVLLVVLVLRLCSSPQFSRTEVFLLAISVLALVTWMFLRNIFGI